VSGEGEKKKENATNFEEKVAVKSPGKGSTRKKRIRRKKDA